MKDGNLLVVGPVAGRVVDLRVEGMIVEKSDDNCVTGKKLVSIVS